MLVPLFDVMLQYERTIRASLSSVVSYSHGLLSFISVLPSGVVLLYYELIRYFTQDTFSLVYHALYGKLFLLSQHTGLSALILTPEIDNPANAHFCFARDFR